MFGREQRKAKLLFGLSDVVITTLAFVLAMSIRSRLQTGFQFVFTRQDQLLVLGSTALFWVATGYWINVYGKLDSARIRTVFFDAFQQTSYGALALIVLVYTLKLEASRVFIGLYIALVFFFLLVFRVAARNTIPVVRRRFGALRYVLIVGVGDRARRLAENLETFHEFGLRILGFMASPDEPAPQSIELDREYRVFPVADLPAMLRRQVIDEVHFAVESDRLPGLEDVLLTCDEEGVTSRIAVDFFPHVNSQVALEKIGVTPLLTFSAAPSDELLLLAKRTGDVVLSSLTIVVLSPFLLFIALLVKLTSPGPVIFKQVRCGLNGRQFTFYKFRSMVQDAEQRMHEVAHLNPKTIVTKIPNDPRLTPVGKWLRKFSIDELPQLFNVLRGDMSIVGPRPAIPSEVAQYKLWQRRRLRMRPGLTCLWVINGRDKVDFETWMRLDMNYIDNWSLALDVKIILQTIPQVLGGKGAS